MANHVGRNRDLNAIARSESRGRIDGPCRRINRHRLGVGGSAEFVGEAQSAVEFVGGEFAVDAHADDDVADAGRVREDELLLHRIGRQQVHLLHQAAIDDNPIALARRRGRGIEGQHMAV